MKVIKNAIVTTIDIDDCLALWVENSDSGPRYDINWKLVEQIRRHKMRGHFVIGWSAGGVEWANRVIKDAGLEPFFDLVMTKPQFMWDDKDPKEWTRVCFIK